jgi:hypothetical protein
VQDERQAILLCILKVIADLLRKREVLYVFYLFKSPWRQLIEILRRGGAQARAISEAGSAIARKESGAVSRPGFRSILA